METVSTFDQMRTEAELVRMYHEAGELEDDDDDLISPDSFLEICHIFKIGIGIHPVKRAAMIEAAKIAHGDGGSTANGAFVTS